MSMWKKFKLVYKIPLHGPKNSKKGNNSGNIPILKVECDIKNLKLSWKLDCPKTSLCFKNS
jgi:hypothetical protein